MDQPNSSTGDGVFLRTADQLSALDESQREFISFISHQLRSPLAAIRLVHQTLLQNEGNTLSVDQLHLIQQAEKRAVKINDLINQLVKSNYAASNRTVSSKHPQNLELFLSDLVDEQVHNCVNKNISIEKLFATNQPLVPFDRSVLSHAITNLLDNAVTYTPAGGVVKVVTDYSEPGYVIIKISDTGMGVPEADRSLLFQKYNRLKNAKQNHPDGLGLGLYIARKSVEEHDGLIAYEPNQPTGSVFVIKLPL